MITAAPLLFIIAFFLYSLYGIIYPDGTFNFLFECGTLEYDCTRSLIVEGRGPSAVELKPYKSV